MAKPRGSADYSLDSVVEGVEVLSCIVKR